MPKRIVLVEPEYARYRFNYVPQGLLSIAAKLEREGFDVSVHSSLPLPGCDVLGISASTPQYSGALRIAIGSRNRAGKIVLGGAHATTSIAGAMGAHVLDMAVIGDGEDAFLGICSGRSPRKIPGVAYRDSGIVIANPNLPFKYDKRSNILPVPAYHLWQGKMGDHVNIYKNREYEWKFLWVRSNRPKWWMVLSKEISALLNLGVRSVTITDENFGHTGIKKTVEVLDRLDNWYCRSSVRNVLCGKLDLVLGGSKCREIEIDIVTASKKLLARFADHTVEEARLAIEKMEKVGIGVVIKTTLGLPGETKSSMMEAWRWLEGRCVRFETMSPYPGTVFFESPEMFSQFGFEVTAINTCDFDADNNGYPWRQETIHWSDFGHTRSLMMKEFGVVG